MTNLTAERTAEITALAVRNSPAPITVKVDRRRYEISGGLLSIIHAERSHAGSFRRGGYVRDNVRILTALRNMVADSLGTDRSTAYQILRKIR